MSEKRKKKNQLLVFLLITLCACGNQEGTRDNDTATEFVRERRERKDSGSVVQTTEKDEPQKILSDKKETETAHMDEQDTSTSSKQVSASVEMREKPLFQPLSEKSSVENVENYVQMIDHVKAMTDQNGYAGVGSNNYHRTEYPGGYYYDELIRTVRSSGEDSELDSLNGKYGYSDYTVTFYYNNPDYENNEDILSDGPIMIEGLFNGNKFQYYFFQNNMIRRVAANAVTDNPATNEFLRELYRIGFDIRWSFNEATMGAIPEQNTAQNVNIETQYIEVPIESPDTDQGYYYYISAKNDAGREIWNYTSNIQEMIGDYYWVYPIGENGDHFLFCDEEIVCMDKYSGQVLWNCERNNLGGPFCFDEDDNLFTSRGIGFGITMISPDGRILKNTDDYSYDVSIWFVDEMHIEKEKLYVEGSGTTIVLDLTDMTAEYE